MARFTVDSRAELGAYAAAAVYVDINGNFLDNADGPEVWYTDPMGHHATQSPFPGSIRQFIARKKSSEAFRFDGPGLGDDRDYGGSGVHAPN